MRVKGPRSFQPRRELASAEGIRTWRATCGGHPGQEVGRRRCRAPRPEARHSPAPAPARSPTGAHASDLVPGPGEQLRAREAAACLWSTWPAVGLETQGGRAALKGGGPGGGQGEPSQASGAGFPPRASLRTSAPGEGGEDGDSNAGDPGAESSKQEEAHTQSYTLSHTVTHSHKTNNTHSHTI